MAKKSGQKNIKNKTFKTQVYKALKYTLLLLLLVVGAVNFSKYYTSAGDTDKNEYKKTSVEELNQMINLFGLVMETIEKLHVNEVSEKKLIEDAIKGMLQARDPHSDFFNEEEYTEFKDGFSGEFGGLGIEVTMEKEVVKVISPIDDTPAYKAGIKSGDYITHIDGKQVQGLSLREAVNLMKGKPGTKVEVTVYREGEKTFDVELVREKIKAKAVKYRLKRDDEIAYLRISTFNEKTFSEMESAIKDMKKESKNIRGVILDLRNNPGGSLQQAVYVSDAFINQGEIVSVISRQVEGEEDEAATGKSSRSFFAKKGDLFEGKPIVVLINQGSASASEIVAGALKDHRRAVILGKKSYGKGSVQSVIPLMDGKVAMKITTAKYYTPSGVSIQAKGIEPDVEVEYKDLKEDEDKEEGTKNSFSEASLRGALTNDNSKKDDKKEKKELTVAEKDQKDRDDRDYQLQRALDLVTALEKFSQNFDVKKEKEENLKKEKSDKVVVSDKKDAEKDSKK